MSIINFSLELIDITHRTNVEILNAQISYVLIA